MTINWRNIVGLIGIAAIIAFGPRLLHQAGDWNPGAILGPLFAWGEPGMLVLLGAATCVTLLLIHHSR